MDVTVNDFEKFQNTQWKVRTELPNGDVLSTVQLPLLMGRLHPKWESCMFYAQGGSDVIEQYHSKEEALDAHLTLVQEMLK